VFRKLKSLLRNKQPAIDLSILKADIHSHLIPGIDDGAVDMEESIAMIKKLYELGFQKLITTPHIMTDTYKNTPEIILDGLQKVQKAIKEENIPIEIEAAAEYYLDENFEQKLDREILTFGDNYLLFEFSYMNKPIHLERLIFKMHAKGLKPVLAHPERYGFLFDKKLKHFIELKELNVLFQMNLFSLTSAYPPQIRTIAKKLIDNELYDFVGTDVHSTGQFDYLNKNPDKKYFKKILNYEGLLNQSLL